MLIIIILGWFESFRVRLRPPFDPQKRYSAHRYGSYRDRPRQKSVAMSYVSQHTLLVSDGIVEVGLHLHIFWAKPWFIGRRSLLKPILSLEFFPFVRWLRLRHELNHAFCHRLTLLLQLRVALSAARGIQVDLQKLKLLRWVEQKVESVWALVPKNISINGKSKVMRLLRSFWENVKDLKSTLSKGVLYWSVKNQAESQWSVSINLSAWKINSTLLRFPPPKLSLSNKYQNARWLHTSPFNIY